MFKALYLGPRAFRKILPMLTAQGYGIIVPEMLGYGETDRPTEAKEYSRASIAEHVAGILTAEKVDRVIVLGHDWVRAEQCTHLRSLDSCRANIYCRARV